jgi:hypothetical protein
MPRRVSRDLLELPKRGKGNYRLSSSVIAQVGFSGDSSMRLGMAFSNTCLVQGFWVR